MKMKTNISRFLVVGLCVALLPLVESCAIERMMGCLSKETLNIYNWGEYMDSATITSFEEKYNVCVNVSTFPDNETVVTKMRLQSFDVIFPSEVAVQQLVSEDRLEELDWDKIIITDKAGNERHFDATNDLIDPLVAQLAKAKSETGFDYLKYAAPYFFQNITLVYNTKVISKEEIEEQQWNILRNPKYKGAVRESSRDAFMIALHQLGYSSNTTDLEKIGEAETWLKEQKKVMGSQIAYLIDEVIDDVPAGLYDAAMVFSGDAFTIMDANEDIDFYNPSVGTDICWDSMIVPKNAQNKELAYKFIGHMLSYEQGLLNTEMVGYTSPLKDVYNDVIASLEDPRLIGIYSVITSETDEVYSFDLATKQAIESAWARVKASS
ncbi:MAG: extracellular solute-binding protein [Bacilli bacterium]|nr:extracellular solute-binding protein [Bacilli bacterium]MDD4065403.1 extracellular solute-binding protein [Bacilli bacterium]